jgi:hypothetical protein
MRIFSIAIACALCVAGCAGRDGAPIATDQPQDQTSDSAMISAEIEANDAKTKIAGDTEYLPNSS